MIQPHSIMNQFMEMPGIEPGSAGSEARTLPLCYATRARPPIQFTLELQASPRVDLHEVHHQPEVVVDGVGLSGWFTESAAFVE